MKKILVAFVLSLTSVVSFSQDYKIVRKAVPLLSQQRFYLNGGIRSQLGGISRIYLQIDLPPNTVEWFYSFTTTPDSQSNANLNLLAQVAKAADRSGMASIAAAAILAPTGVAKAHVYVTDLENIRLFMQKADNEGKPFKRDLAISRENYTEGVVEVKNERSGTWYIGIKNPSEYTGINVRIEAVAIVEERVLIKKTEAQTKAELYTNLGWNAFMKGDYAKCIEMSKKAVEFDQNTPAAKLNLSLCYLIQNKTEYLDSYVDAIACCKRSPYPKEYLENAIKDIKDAQQKGTAIANADEILSLLKQELSGYN